MKKILTLLALMLVCSMGAMAQGVTDRASAGDPMTFDQFKALAGTGKHFALMAPSTNDLTYKKWFSFSKDGYPTTLTTVQLFDLENSTTGDGWYNIKRVSDGLYVSTEGGNFAASPKMDFKLVNRRAGDYADEFSNSELHVSLDNAAGNHYNCNTTNLGFRGGTGGFSTYITYGPFYLVTLNFINESTNDPIQASETYIVKDGTTISAPAISPYTSKGESVTVNGADEVLNCYYTPPTSFDYTVVISSNLPAGSTVTINGSAVSNNDIYSSNAVVTADDVVVTFPTEFSYLTKKVTVSGGTITVDCEDNRWPVNFDKSTVSTHASRYTDMVGLDDQTISWSSHPKDVIYRDLTDQTITVPAGKTVTPVIGYRGWAMYGYLYIDYNNDGDFTDEGELVSQLGGNIWTSGSTADKTIPAFTLTNTPGIYRARFKVEWNNTDPGGHVPSMDEHGGSITDVLLEVKTKTAEEIYDELITQLEAINFGTGLNQYSFTGSYVGYPASTINDLKAQGYTAENLEMAEALLANYALNMPTAGFYRIKGNTSSKYVGNSHINNSGTKYNMTDATDATTVFYYDGTKLYNYSTALCFDLPSWKWSYASETTDVEFIDGLSNGGYAIINGVDKKDATKSIYLYDNGKGSTPSTDRGGMASFDASVDGRYRNWYLEEVTSLPLTLTDCSNYWVDGYYTTMYLPVNVTVTGAKVYTVNDGVGNSLDVEELTDGFVPENTGVVLEGTSASATATVSTATGTVTSVLTGTAPVMSYDPANENVYVLSVANSKLGFYKFAGTELKGFRAYYQTTGGGSSTRGFVLNFGGTATGINAATLNGEGNAYDLQGRRVNNAQKGIFIINGKKVVK